MSVFAHSARTPKYTSVVRKTVGVRQRTALRRPVTVDGVLPLRIACCKLNTGLSPLNFVQVSFPVCESPLQIGLYQLTLINKFKFDLDRFSETPEIIGDFEGSVAQNQSS